MNNTKKYNDQFKNCAYNIEKNIAKPQTTEQLRKYLEKYKKVSFAQSDKNLRSCSYTCLPNTHHRRPEDAAAAENITQRFSDYTHFNRFKHERNIRLKTQGPVNVYSVSSSPNQVNTFAHQLIKQVQDRADHDYKYPETYNFQVKKRKVEKQTYCRPALDMYNKDLIYKTMEKTARLRDLVRRLIIAREREKLENLLNQEDQDYLFRSQSSSDATENVDKIGRKLFVAQSNSSCCKQHPKNTKDINIEEKQFAVHEPLSLIHLSYKHSGTDEKSHLDGCLHDSDNNTSIQTNNHVISQEIRKNYQNDNNNYSSKTKVPFLKMQVFEDLQNDCEKEHWHQNKEQETQKYCSTPDRDKTILTDLNKYDTDVVKSAYPINKYSLKIKNDWNNSTLSYKKPDNDQSEMHFNSMETKNNLTINTAIQTDSHKIQLYSNVLKADQQVEADMEKLTIKQKYQKCFSKNDKSIATEDINIFEETEEIFKDSVEELEITIEDALEAKCDKVSENISKKEDINSASITPNTLNNIESKLDSLLSSINDLMMEMRNKNSSRTVKTKKSYLIVNNVESCNKMKNLGGSQSEPVGDKQMYNHSSPAVTNNSDSTMFVSETDSNNTKPSDCLKRSNAVKRAIAEIERKVARDINTILNNVNKESYNEHLSNGDVPKRDTATETTNSQIDKQKDQSALSVNSERMGLVSLVKTSAEMLKQLMSYMPGILPNYPVTQKNDMSFICNICGARFSKSTELSTHIATHTVSKVRDCCVCRHVADERTTFVEKSCSFGCKYCGQRFTRAYCCELHQQACALSHGRQLLDRPSLLILR
ncbi:DNA-directed RNA polymerase III subunit RPC1 isoform X1 [Plutella xylostella]|uniref:DNA-directed RNA polymerase III subunit RPC1 isoform X1 n=2 Tax=Plutella xylostella TaxID=51655 RepID=UPI002032839D|nr:DNA-directed RNA polymerase III subunit RPC1 isoform X1 [Plutella xylostella]